MSASMNYSAIDQHSISTIKPVELILPKIMLECFFYLVISIQYGLSLRFSVHYMLAFPYEK